MRLSDYDYSLPPAQIARYPLPLRAAARLLVYRRGRIGHHRFYELPALLPPETTVVINTTRVVPARLFFRKATGALIEVLCLGPAESGQPPEAALRARGQVRWECKVGNLRRWKGPLVRQSAGIRLTAELSGRRAAHAIVRFRWEPAGKTFAEVLEAFGHIPLPPYLDREAEPVDRQRYQTVFARQEGAVAAPTASLHFTPALMEKLRGRFPVAEVILHVGAGTFQPIRTADPAQHPMHAESVRIHRSEIEKLAAAAHITAVGTTAARTLESLYWHAMAARFGGGNPGHLDVSRFSYREQWSPIPPFREMMGWLSQQMDTHAIDHISGQTRLFIMPPYVFRAVQGMITNFHLPRSTLLLLVDAFVKGAWRPIYEEALRTGYRFLSYGDTSLLLP